MNILLVTIGSAGDVHPYVGLGIALKQRGHHVTLITSGYFQSLATSAGLDFDPMGTAEEFDQSARNPDLWHKVRGTKMVLSLITRQLRPLYDKIIARYVPGETIVVASSLALGARIAQDKHGIPTATIHLSPSIPRSLHETPNLPGFPSNRWIPRVIKRLAFSIADNFVIDPLLAPEINRVRADLGLAPVSHIMKDWWHSPDRIIGLWPEWFGPIQPDWPKQIRLTSFPLWDERGVTYLSPDLQKFLNEGEPPIAFTPGSAMQFGHEFFRESTGACQLLGRRGILLSRHREHIPADLPPTVRHYDYAPFSELLPRCAAVVHHGGIGSASQALAAGTPQLVMAMAHDQFDNADRIQRLGVGKPISRAKYRAKIVAKRLAELIDSPTVRDSARSVAQKLKGVDALGQTCDIIEELAKPAQPRTPRLERMTSSM